LAHWYDGHLPGDVIDVDSDTARALQRDGRVNAVLPDDEPKFAEGGVLEPAVSEAVNESGEAEAVAAPPKRGRKAATEE
jgi:hypothetical protein